MRVRHIVVSSLALATFACGVIIGIDERSLDEQLADAGGGLDANTSDGTASDATDSSSNDGPIVDAGCPDACTRCVDNRCIIECSGDKPCPKTITCPPAMGCRVICDGDAGKACEGRTVDCSQSTSCRFDCDGPKDNCDNVKVNAGGGSLCITCKGADAACDDIQCTSAKCTRICAGGVGGSCTSNTCSGTCTGGSSCP